MLTLFAKSDAKRDDHLDFLYTGRLIDKINFEDGRYEHVAFRCLHQRELWIIPPSEFDLDNKTMVHAAHMLHQPKAIAHFEFSKHGRLSYIKQMKGWKKGDRLFVNYGIEGKDVWGTGYINLAAGMDALEDLDCDDSPGKSLTRSSTRLSGESEAIAPGEEKVVATLDEEKIKRKRKFSKRLCRCVK